MSIGHFDHHALVALARSFDCRAGTRGHSLSYIAVCQCPTATSPSRGAIRSRTPTSTRCKPQRSRHVSSTSPSGTGSHKLSGTASAGWPFWVPSSEEAIERALDLAAITKGDVVADLGCGDGRVLAAEPPGWLPTHVALPGQGDRVALPDGTEGVLIPLDEGYLLRPVAGVDQPSA